LTKTRTGFETHFGPKELGTHLVHVNYDNKEVPGTPIPVDVQAVVDLNKVEIRGLEKRKCTIGIIIIISPIKGHRCFLEQETLALLLSTGWFQERI